MNCWGDTASHYESNANNNDENKKLTKHDLKLSG